MKKWMVVSLVAALLLASTIPAFAMGRRPPKAGPRVYAGAELFTVAGVITSIDSAAQTITLQVIAGDRLIKFLIGQELTVQTGDTTRFLLKTSSGTTFVSFGDLAVDQKVSVQGYALDDMFTAQRITIGANLIHQP